MTGLPGPVGERNRYSVRPRGRVLLLPKTAAGLEEQLGLVSATGNIPVLPDEPAMRELFAAVGPELTRGLSWAPNWERTSDFAHVLIEDNGDDICPVLKAIAAGDGPIPIVQLGGRGAGYMAAWMLEEVVVSIDTTAAGGNASLMALA